MKATIQGIEVEGTPEEMAELLNCQKPYEDLKNELQLTEPMIRLNNITVYPKALSELLRSRPLDRCTIYGHQHKVKDCPLNNWA